MKKKMLLFPLVLFILLLAACSNPKLFNLASITQLFEDAELNLKPQAEDSYPTIMSVKPGVYELLDDLLYVYVFKSEDELIKASKELNVEKVFNDSSYVYQMKNVLMIYISQSPADVNFNNQIEDIIAKSKEHGIANLSK